MLGLCLAVAPTITIYYSDTNALVITVSGNLQVVE